MKDTKSPLTVLILEDNPGDAELLRHELRNSSFDVLERLVVSKADYAANLGRDIDVIVADFVLPQFNALEALEILKATGLDIPFIIVSGQIGEEVAVLALKRGATDYVMKDGLGRLGPAIHQALESKRLRALKELAEKTLREKDLCLQAVFDQTFGFIAMLHPDGVLIDVNRSLLALSGFRREEVLGRLFWEEVWWGGCQEIQASIKADFFNALQGAIIRRETPYFTSKGDRRVMDCSMKPIRNAQGEIVLILAEGRDITRLRETDKAAQDKEKCKPFSFNVLKEAFISMDAVGRVLEWNVAAEEVFGWSRAEMLGQGLAETVIPPQYWEVFREALRQMVASGEGPLHNTSFEVALLRRDGREVPVEVVLWSVRDAGSPVFHAFLHETLDRKEARDVQRETHLRLEQALADLKAAQQQIIQQERLRALGQMASGIAHDFNNALSPILGFSDLLLIRPEVIADRAKARSYLRTINTSAKDAAKVVGRLREFYRHREDSEILLPVALNPLIEQAVTLTRPRWQDEARARGANIEVVTDLRQIPLVPGNESELREVLVNLIFNAVDAMPSGGKMSIRTRLEADPASGPGKSPASQESSGGNGRAPRAEGIDPEASFVPYPRIVLEFSDTGVGMPEEVRRRCFEPFFSTKGEQGTGLGLSVVHGITRRHSGSIELRSQVGQGTTLSLRLPVLKPGVSAEPVAVASPVPRHLRVLVVEDEPDIRELLSEYLKQDGHHVETAANGREGLTLFHAGRFDLILTDRAMPEMSGDQFAVLVKQWAPNKPIILLTGFGDLMKATNEKAAGVDLVLSKPAGLPELRQAISRVMGLAAK
ncbi:MAG: response regulator [Planctomycetes bacterium]|nr:response regulator [Planctomycetota bacterium]